MSVAASQVDDGYDIVVVGLGLAGSVVASKMARGAPDRKILAIEGGALSDQGTKWLKSRWSKGPPEFQEWGLQGLSAYDVPAAYSILPCWDMKCNYCWQNLPSFQAKAVGGSDVMNGALAMRVPPEMFGWWSTHSPYPSSWSYAHLADYFAEIEQRFDVTPTPSADHQHYLDDTGTEQLRKALGAVGFTWVGVELPSDLTMGYPNVVARHGKRQSTASIFLQGDEVRNNLEVWVDTEVLRIEHNGQRSTGLIVKRNGREEVVPLSSRGLVVLTAGALNTPRVLIQSGIGPYNQVSFRPGPHVINEYIGASLSDHAITWATYSFPKNFSLQSFSFAPPPSWARDQYKNHRSGPLAQYGPIFVAYIKDEKQPLAPQGVDVEVFTTPSESENIMKVYFVLLRPNCSSAKLSVDDSGSVRFDFGDVYLGCDRDRQVMTRSFNIVDAALRNMGAKLDAIDASTQSWLQGHPLNHWAGTCSLGTCADSNTLRIQGLENVAVADASIVPSQIWAHPWMTLTATSLMASDRLLASLPERQSSVSRSVLATSSFSPSTSRFTVAGAWVSGVILLFLWCVATFYYWRKWKQRDSRSSLATAHQEQANAVATLLPEQSHQGTCLQSD